MLPALGYPTVVLWGIGSKDYLEIRLRYAYDNGIDYVDTYICGGFS